MWKISFWTIGGIERLRIAGPRYNAQGHWGTKKIPRDVACKVANWTRHDPSHRVQLVLTLVNSTWPISGHIPLSLQWRGRANKKWIRSSWVCAFWWWSLLDIYKTYFHALNSSLVSLGSGVSKERKGWKDYANQRRSTREKQEIGIEELQGFRVYTGYCGAEWTVNQQPPTCHPFGACYHSIVDGLQLSFT
jgi:hypothetical protein